MRLLPFGPAAALVEVDAADGIAGVHRAWRAVAGWSAAGRVAAGWGAAGIEDVVPAARSVLVRAAPSRWQEEDLATRLAGLLADRGGPSLATEREGAPPAPAPGEPGGESRSFELPVLYDGPDLAEVADTVGLSVEEVVTRHGRRTYTVDFLGFSPGFAYLSGGDPALAVPRRPTPRTSVPAGSVGLAGTMTAVYPSSTPGGWQLIGRTDRALFVPTRRPPALMAPGDTVRFVAVDRLGPSRRSTPAPDRAPAAGEVPSDPGLEVLEAGLLSSVQDTGRPGWAHVGVPRAGAVDPPSLAQANALVGNPADSAGLECTLAGPRLRMGRPLTLAVAGAIGDLRLDGRPVPHGQAFLAGPGSVLEVGAFTSGVRAYLAVSGGLAVAPVLGSRSADTLCGLGPPPLAAGDVLPVGFGAPTALGAPAAGSGRPEPAAALPESGRVVVLDVQPGPDQDRLGPAGLDGLTSRTWLVSADADRTGVRLDGPALALAPAEPLASKGMVAGAVQVPDDGRPIVLMANHATTGGYPVAAVLSAPSQALMAQCRAGTEVRFRLSPAGAPWAPWTW